MSQVIEKPGAEKKPRFHPYPWYSPRFWHGMRVGDWSRLLIRNRFRIHPSRIPLTCTVTAATLFNSTLALMQRAFYGRRIANTPVEQPPVFIIGHWRSGTTYLHELLVRDARFAFPTTFECFVPSHFLISRWFLPQTVGFLLPGKRPMDNMSAGFHHPQEDEFALCNLGSGTPYCRMAFPNLPPPFLEFLDMEGIAPAALAKWKRDMRYFVQTLTLAKGKRLIMKSPPHTGRLAVLSELFPQARFVHIARDPEAVFSSTRRLWPSLDAAQGLQVPQYHDLDEFIFRAFERMYSGFFRQLESIDPARICEVRYEDVVQDPIGQIAAMYRHLDLGDFEPMRGSLEEFLGHNKDYQTNRHPDLEPEIKAAIRRRWANYIERYGYA